MVAQPSPFLSQIASAAIHPDRLLQLLRDQCPSNQPQLSECHQSKTLWRNVDPMFVTCYIDCIRLHPTHFTWPLYFKDIVSDVLSWDDHIVSDPKLAAISVEGMTI